MSTAEPNPIVEALRKNTCSNRLPTEWTMEEFIQLTGWNKTECEATFMKLVRTKQLNTDGVVFWWESSNPKLDKEIVNYLQNNPATTGVKLATFVAKTAVTLGVLNIPDNYIYDLSTRGIIKEVEYSTVGESRAKSIFFHPNTTITIC